MDNVQMMSRVVDETKQVVDRVDDTQWALSTPCSEWTVRDLVNHLTGGATMFAIAVEDGSISDDLVGQLVGGDNVGDDPRAAFRAAADRADAAFTNAESLDTIVKLPFGEMPAAVALNIAIFDVTVHALDIARATGQRATLDPDVLGAALDAGRQMIGPDIRVPGLFEAETSVPAGAPVEDQLLAFAGRAV